MTNDDTKPTPKSTTKRPSQRLAEKNNNIVSTNLQLML